MLTTNDGTTIKLTAGHHLPVGATCCSVLKQAGDIEVGEIVYLARGIASATTVTEVSEAVDKGVHSPVLQHGTYPVVDGVVTSFDSKAKVGLASYGLPLLEAAGAADLFRRTFLGAEHKYIEGR